MNWTGGQLQRHHTRSGLLTKAQKRNFAKSRLKNTAIAASPFRNFPEGPGTGKDGPAKSTESKIQSVGNYWLLELDFQSIRFLY